MNYNCELLERPAQPVMSIRTHVAVQDIPQAFGQSCGAIEQYLSQAGQPPIGAPFAAYYNMDMQNLDIEIGFPVTKAVPGVGEIQPGEIPAGEWLSCLHSGPYDQCAVAYAAMQQWLDANKREATGVSYEIYLNDPAVTPPETLQTQILFPLK